MLVLSEAPATYLPTKDILDQEEMVVKYLPLVRSIARRLFIKLPNGVDRADLAGYGTLGLLDAIEKFDTTKGVKFETYASVRIRGEILDQVRRLDWIPRSIRLRARECNQARILLEEELCRRPTEEEIAGALGLKSSTIQKAAAAENVTIHSLDEVVRVDSEGNSVLIADMLGDPDEEGRFAEVENKMMWPFLIEATRRLTPRMQQVIGHVYRDKLTMKEIGRSLGISETRVSQLHAQAMQKLQFYLGRDRLDYCASFTS